MQDSAYFQRDPSNVIVVDVLVDEIITLSAREKQTSLDSGGNRSFPVKFKPPSRSIDAKSNPWLESCLEM